MKYFLEHNGKKYSDKDLIDAFYQLGIKRGEYFMRTYRTYEIWQSFAF